MVNIVSSELTRLCMSWLVAAQLSDLSNIGYQLMAFAYSLISLANMRLILPSSLTSLSWC